VRGLLYWGREGCGKCEWERKKERSKGEDERAIEREAYFYLKEILRRTIDLFEALLARIGHCLHGCGLKRVMRKKLLALLGGFVTLLLFVCSLRCGPVEDREWSCEVY